MRVAMQRYSSSIRHQRLRMGKQMPMQYDVLTPDKKALGGLIPWTAKYNSPGGK